MFKSTERLSRYLIYFILAALPLERIPSLDITHPTHITIRLSQVAGLLLIAINVPTMWEKRRQLVRQPWMWLALFILIELVSSLQAASHSRGLLVTLYTAFDIVLAWVISLRFEKTQLSNYLKFLLAGAVATVLFGFYQFFGDLAGLSTHWTGLRAMYTKAVFGFPRIQSTGLEPLYYSDYLLIPSALLISYWLYRGLKMRYLLFLGLILTVVWMGLSRGAIVALAGEIVAGIIIAGWHKQWRKGSALAATAAGTFALAIALIFFGSHLSTAKQSQHSVSNFSHQVTNVSDGGSAHDRSVTRQLAARAFASHPVLGLGPGNFGRYAYEQMPASFTDRTIVNNETLEILAETGALGFISLAMFIFALLRQFGQVLPKAGQDRWWMVGLLMALIAIAAQYQTFSTLYITHIWVAIGLLAGAASQTVKVKEGSAKKANPSPA